MLVIAYKLWMSSEQCFICSLRGSGFTYAQIRLHLGRWFVHVGKDEALSRCFKRTALGLFWHPGMKGGGMEVLCREYRGRLIEAITDAAAELSAAPTSYVISYAHELIITRHSEAACFLRF